MFRLVASLSACRTPWSSQRAASLLRFSEDVFGVATALLWPDHPGSREIWVRNLPRVHLGIRADGTPTDDDDARLLAHLEAALWLERAARWEGLRLGDALQGEIRRAHHYLLRRELVGLRGTHPTLADCLRPDWSDFFGKPHLPPPGGDWELWRFASGGVVIARGPEGAALWDRAGFTLRVRGETVFSDQVPQPLEEARVDGRSAHLRGPRATIELRQQRCILRGEELGLALAGWTLEGSPPRLVARRETLTLQIALDSHRDWQIAGALQGARTDRPARIGIEWT